MMLLYQDNVGATAPKEVALFQGSNLLEAAQNSADLHYNPFMYPRLSFIARYQNSKLTPSGLPPTAVHDPALGNLYVYLRVQGIAVHNAYGKRTIIIPENANLAVDALGGLEALHARVLLALQDKQAKKNDTDMSTVRIRNFRLVHIVKINAHEEMVPLTEENVILSVARTRKVYVEYLQASYSNTTNTILDKFAWPFDLSAVPLDSVYSTLKSDHNTNSANKHAADFVTRMAEDLNSEDESSKRTAERWRKCVARAAAALDDISISAPILKSYNEATRRMIIDVIAVQVSVFLTRTFFVEAYQCANQAKPPDHFQGTGSLDYVVGLGSRTCIEIFPTLFHTRAAETPRTDEEEVEEDEDEGCEAGVIDSEDRAVQLTELQAGDPLSAVFLSASTDLEAKQKITLAALRQLLAQIFDKVFVSDEDLLIIANHGAVAKSAAGKGPASSKRKVMDEEPRRLHQRLTGVLSTGHTWQVYNFSFASKEEMLQPDAKMSVEYAGEFLMPVLQHESPVGGATKPSSVNKGNVEKVMAMLLASD